MSGGLFQAGTPPPAPANAEEAARTMADARIADAQFSGRTPRPPAVDPYSGITGRGTRG